ncbi:MAG: helix-turn-helix domain-containing protein [Gemmatimonadota bacterium]
MPHRASKGLENSPVGGFHDRSHYESHRCRTSRAAQMMNTSRQTVGKWRERFRTQGLMGLYDEPRPGRQRSIEEERIMELLYKTLHTKPAGESFQVLRSAWISCGKSSTSDPNGTHRGPGQ